MKVSLKWLNEIISIDKSEIKKISDQLTMAGFEVESIESKFFCGQEDTVIDISSTANRSDALSLFGIAREIATLSNRKIKFHVTSNLDVMSNITSNIYNLQVLDKHMNCIACTLQNFSMIPLRQDIVEYLNNIEVPIGNNIENLNNYILYKWGQPIYAFDLDQICNIELSKDIFISNDYINHEELYYCSDGTEVSLDKNDDLPMLSINNIKIAIPGLISLNNAKVNKNSNRIIIIAPIFDRKLVRQISKKVNKRTESSIRYERGIDLSLLKYSFQEFLMEILKTSPSQITSYYENIHILNRAEILIYNKNIYDILGYVYTNNNQGNKYIDISTIHDILIRLGFVIHEINDNYIKLSPPIHRLTDIAREIDVIEEISRIYGFDQFAEKIPTTFKKRKCYDNMNYIKNIKKLLYSLGLTEVINYSLIKAEKKDLVLDNPLLKDYSSLRTSVLQNLLDNIKYNINNNNECIEGFEIGKVFFKKEHLIKESTHLACVLGGNLNVRSLWNKKPNILSWFSAKGIIEKILQELNCELNWIPISDNNSFYEAMNIFHPYRSALLTVNNESIGIFGELLNTSCKLENFSYQIYAFEVDLKKLDNSNFIGHNSYYRYNHYSSYPSVYRDITLIVPQDFKSIDVIQYCKNINDNDYLQSIELFDEYKSKDNKKKSLGLRLCYQSNIKTLTNNDVDTLLKRLRINIAQNFNFILE